MQDRSHTDRWTHRSSTVSLFFAVPDPKWKDKTTRLRQQWNMWAIRGFCFLPRCFTLLADRPVCHGRLAAGTFSFQSHALRLIKKTADSPDGHRQCWSHGQLEINRCFKVASPVLSLPLSTAHLSYIWPSPPHVHVDLWKRGWSCEVKGKDERQIAERQ